MTEEERRAILQPRFDRVIAAHVTTLVAVGQAGYRTGGRGAVLVARHRGEWALSYVREGFGPELAEKIATYDPEREVVYVFEDAGGWLQGRARLPPELWLSAVTREAAAQRDGEGGSR